VPPEPTDEKTETPADRVRAAITGLKDRAIPPVRAADVIALVAVAAPGKLSPAHVAIGRGCRGALRGVPEHATEEVIVHVQAGDLAQILEAAGGNPP
jgi:hypothetical protein